MLVLARKPGETILIGGNIRVMVSSVKCEVVRIAIDAPLEIRVLREELKGSPPPPEKAAE